MASVGGTADSQFDRHPFNRADPAAEGWSSTGIRACCCPRPGRCRELVVNPKSKTTAMPSGRRGIRRAWTARERLDHGEPLTWASSVK